VRIAIAQLPMHPTPDENTRCVLDYLAQAKRLEADLVLFPECAITGYHRGVPGQISRRLVRGSLERIQAQCAALELPAIAGTPFFPTSEAAVVWNAAVAIDACGKIRAICAKAGLTESERRYFHPGDLRTVFTLGSFSCSVLLCREVRDAERLRDELGGVQLLFWPGVIAWGTRGAHPENVITREIAQECARTLGAHLIQCNWASSLNQPVLRGMGGSMVLSPAGAILFECPLDEAGISLVELPERADLPDRDARDAFGITPLYL
jgi:omega-amidase